MKTVARVDQPSPRLRFSKQLKTFKNFLEL
jgi:hypothetical protein